MPNTSQITAEEESAIQYVKGVKEFYSHAFMYLLFVAVFVPSRRRLRAGTPTLHLKQISCFPTCGRGNLDMRNESRNVQVALRNRSCIAGGSYEIFRSIIGSAAAVRRILR